MMDIVFADCPVVSGPAFEESDLMQTRPPQRNLPRLYMFMACTQSYTRGCVDHREYIVYSEIAFAPWRDRGTHRGHLRCGTPYHIFDFIFDEHIIAGIAVDKMFSTHASISRWIPQTALPMSPRPVFPLHHRGVRGQAVVTIYLWQRRQRTLPCNCRCRCVVCTLFL